MPIPAALKDFSSPHFYILPDQSVSGTMGFMLEFSTSSALGAGQLLLI
jgi:hypothetical protein